MSAKISLTYDNLRAILYFSNSKKLSVAFLVKFSLKKKTLLRARYNFNAFLLLFLRILIVCKTFCMHIRKCRGGVPNFFDK